MTELINLKVKSTLSDTDTLDIIVNINETIQQLKLIILNKLLKNNDCTAGELVSETTENSNQDSNSKRVRLIYNGRLLQPDTKFLKDCNIENKSYIHAVISNIDPDKAYSHDYEESINEMSALNTENSGVSGEPNGSSIGLNRLLRNGFSSEEIQTLRFLFSVNIRAFRQVMPQRQNETEEVYQLRLEDAFLESENIYMRNQSIASSFLRSANVSTNTMILGSNNGGVRVAATGSSSSNDEEIGDQRDFWFGFLIGVTVGFIVLFCVWDRNISYRQKLGLLFGVAISTLLEMYSVEKMTSSSSSSSDYKSLRGSQ